MQMYHRGGIITRELYILNPLFEVQKRFFRKILPLYMISIQERLLIKSVFWWRVYGMVLNKNAHSESFSSHGKVLKVMEPNNHFNGPVM